MLQFFRTRVALDRPDWNAAVAFATEGSLFPDSELHGEDHWRAVATQGLRVAEILRLGAEGRAAAALFGLFHDCRRENDGWDPEHGSRGASAFRRCTALGGLPERFGHLLAGSMIMHDGGETSENPIVGLGWDADRSVLTRVGIVPDFHFFSCVPTEAFETFIEDGYRATAAPLSWDEIYTAAFARH